MKIGNDWKDRAFLFSVLAIAIFGWTFFLAERSTNQAAGKGAVKIECLTDEIKRLQDSYNRFRSMSGEQMHDVWNDTFWDCEYQIDGKIRENEFDCGTAETKFWRTLGANVVYESTEMKEARLKRVTDPYKRIKGVRVGDIIIFKRTEKYGHIAVVDRVRKKKIRYMDFNVGDNGQGFKTIAFDDLRIQNIYPMTFDYWAGDVLCKFDKVEE